MRSSSGVPPSHTGAITHTHAVYGKYAPQHAAKHSPTCTHALQRGCHRWHLTRPRAQAAAVSHAPVRKHMPRSKHRHSSITCKHATLHMRQHRGGNPSAAQGLRRRASTTHTRQAPRARPPWAHMRAHTRCKDSIQSTGRRIRNAMLTVEELRHYHSTDCLVGSRKCCVRRDAHWRFTERPLGAC